MTFKFDVLEEAIDTCPELSVGDAVIPTTRSKIAPGGYEYDTWTKLNIGPRSITRGLVVDVLIDHRHKFAEHEVEGDTAREIITKVEEVCRGIRG